MGAENPSQAFTESVTTLMKDGGYAGPLSIEAGDGCESLLNTTKFAWMVTELVNNCAEKDAPDISIHVSISIDAAQENYHMEVEDSVVYSLDEIGALIKNLNSSHPKRMGKKVEREVGGEGIAMCKHAFKLWGGELRYQSSEDNHVVAVADWSKASFFK